MSPSRMCLFSGRPLRSFVRNFVDGRVVEKTPANSARFFDKVPDKDQRGATPPNRCRRIGNFLSAAIFILTLSACADEPFAISARDRYLIDVWQTEQGLPQNHVTSITQTRDGYLWLGTYEGLARFDGVRFASFHAARN